MVLAIANRQNLVDQAHMQQDDETEGELPPPCGFQNPDDPARYCIGEVGHSGRHKFRPSSFDGPLN